MKVDSIQSGSEFLEAFGKALDAGKRLGLHDSEYKTIANACRNYLSRHYSGNIDIRKRMELMALQQMVIQVWGPDKK